MSPTFNSNLQLFTGHFRDFERRCSAHVRDLQKADPFVEVWIVIPNQLTRLHLRRVLARELGQAANLRFLTMNDLTHMLAEPLVMREGWQLLGEAAVDPIVRQVIDSLRPPLEYLAPVAGSPGFRRALLRTRDDLHSHSVAPEKLLHVELRDPERAKKLRDLSRLIAAIDARLKELRLYDANVLQELALKAVRSEQPQLPQIVLYGLYDISPRARALLELCFTRTSSTAFLPHVEETPDFAFTAPLKSWFVNRGFRHEALPVSERAPSVRFVLAPNDSRLASEIVRDTLYPSAATPDEFAIILPPSSEQFARQLESRCANSGLAPFVYQSRTLGDSVCGRGLLALADLLTSDFEQNCIGRYLLCAPFSGAAAEQAGEWQRIAQETRIISGESSWRRNIDRLIRQLEFQIERAAEQTEDAEDDSLATLRRRLVVACGLQEFFEALRIALNAAAAARTWAAAVRTLWDYYSQVAVIDREFADLLVQLDQAATLDVAGIPLSRAALRDFVVTTLATPGSRTGAFGKSQPLIAAREQCCGLTFANVLLPGYNEGNLPRADAQDPLLLDDDRDALNYSLKVALPLRREWQQREAFWFAVAQSSATHGVTFYATRSDQSGRPLLVSPYFTSLLVRHCGFDNTSRDVESFCASHPSCRVVPAHPLSGDLKTAINESEYHRIALGLAQHERSSSPLVSLLNNTGFMRAVEMERARFSATSFGSFDGLLSAEDIRSALSGRYDPRTPQRATALENYWSCPFRYAVMHELEAYVPEELSELDAVPGHLRGTLLHNILQKYHDGKPHTSIAPPHYTWERLAEIADHEFRAFVAKFNIGTRYVQDRLRDDLLDLLHVYFREYIAESGAWSTEHVEVDFGRGTGEFPEPLEWRDANELLRVKGRIDRWDEDSFGTKVRITDYKSGKIPEKKGRSYSRRLQLALYHAFAAQRKPDASVQSEYLHLRDAAVVAAQLAVDHGSALRTALDLAADLRNGVFIPDPAENDYSACKTCNVKLACGAARHTKKPLTAATVPGLRTTRASQMREDGEDADE